MKLRYLTCVVVLLIASAGAGIAAAGPANPRIVTLSQPSGATFQARLVGDEWSHTYQTLDGFSVLRDDTSGIWFYAMKSQDGVLLASPLMVAIDAPAGLQRGVMPERPANAPAIVPPSLTPVLGNRRLLVILVQFSNVTAKTTAASWQSSMFGATNSLKDHYAISSHGAVAVTPATESHGTANDGIVGWLTLASTHPNTAGSTGTANQQLTKDAILAADPFVDFAAYDTNSNGRLAPSELDIIVIAAGNETSYGGGGSCAPSVWGHKWSVFAVTPPTVDAKVVGADGYAQFGEMHCFLGSEPGQIATIGIMVHELGHLYGLPDLYDTDSSSYGIGSWSVMSGGSWNGVMRSGDSPALFDAWSRAALSWVTPTAVTTSGNRSIVASYLSNVVYQFGTGTPGTSGEYFLVENRQQSSYDAGLPGAGLVIWHIDDGKLGNQQECIPGGLPACSASHHLKVAIVQADNNYNIERSQNDGDTGDPFPGSSNRRAFNTASTPSSHYYSGAASNMSVTNISNSGQTMTADMLFGMAAFTDDPLVAGATVAKALHVTELRTRINAVRAARGLAAFTFTDSSLTATASVITAAHILEMRTALLAAYTAAGVAPPAFTDTVLTSVAVKAAHINELRAAVIALE